MGGIKRLKTQFNGRKVQIQILKSKDYLIQNDLWKIDFKVSNTENPIA